MRNLASLPAVLALSAVPALAEVCPAAPDHSAQTNALIESVQDAPNEYEAQQISVELWKYWADAPDDKAQELLD